MHTETQAGQRKESQALRGSGRAAASLEQCRQARQGLQGRPGMRGQIGEGWRMEASVAEKVDSTAARGRARQARRPPRTRAGRAKDPRCALFQVGGRWIAQARSFVRDLVRLKAYRAPPAVTAAATAGWARRWWSMLSVAVPQVVASTALGGAWMQPAAENRRGPALRQHPSPCRPCGPESLALTP